MRTMPWMILLLATSSLRTAEEKLALEHVPAPVARSVRQRFPMAKWLAAAKETDGGATFIEVSLRDRGRHVDVSATPDGEIREIETELPPGEMPEVIRASIERRYPGAKVERAEELIHVRDGKEIKDAFEARLRTQDQKKLEVVLDVKGAITKVEADDEKGD